MKRTLALTFVLVASGVCSAVAQEATAKKPVGCPSKVRYDRFKDETTETCSALVTVNVVKDRIGEVFTVSPTLVYKGKVRQRPLHLTLSIFAFRLSGGTRSVLPPQYDQTTTLYLLTDTARVEIRVLHDPPTLVEGATGEIMHAPLDLKIVRAVIGAKKVECEFGGSEYTFDPPALTAFQGALKQITPLLEPPVATKPTNIRKPRPD
jgi:hypothetical protein